MEQLELFCDKMKIVQDIHENREVFYDAYKLFHKTFRLTFHDFMDFNMSKIARKPILDIYKFEDWLHGKFGDYEKEKLSTLDVLKINYGEETALKIKELVG